MKHSEKKEKHVQMSCGGKTVKNAAADGQEWKKNTWEGERY